MCAIWLRDRKSLLVFTVAGRHANSLLTKASSKTSASFPHCTGLKRVGKFLKGQKRKGSLCNWGSQNVTSSPTCVIVLKWESHICKYASACSISPAFCLGTNPSRALPLDNAIITTKLRAIKYRLRCNSEPGALVCAPSWSYLIHL